MRRTLLAVSALCVICISCAWWQANEPAIGIVTYDTCMVIAMSECVPMGEAQAICKLAQTAEDATRQLRSRAALVCTVYRDASAE